MWSVFGAEKDQGTSISQNFLGCPGGGCFGQNFHKKLKIFFCLGVPNAGPLNVKKFGPLHLSTKFHQNLCSRFKVMTFFRQDMPPKTPTFHLKCHRSDVF